MHSPKRGYWLLAALFVLLSPAAASAFQSSFSQQTLLTLNSSSQIVPAFTGWSFGGNSAFTNASTTLLSSYGPAYFGATATSTFSTSGALTLASPLAVGSGGIGLSSVGASSTVLTTNGSAPAWQKLDLAAAVYGTLPVTNGGTGQISFGQGYLNSNGTTITSTTSPTVNYITATSTATSTFSGPFTATTYAINNAITNFGVLYSVGSDATTSTISNQGTGYFGADSITLTGGTCSTNPVLSVVSTSTNGVITNFQVTNPGVCSAIPANPVSQGSTSGTGSGATFNLKWGPISASLNSPSLGTGNGNLFIGAETPSPQFNNSESVFIGDRAGSKIATSSNFVVAIGHNACGNGNAAPTIGNVGSTICLGTDSGRNIGTGAGGNIIIGTGVGENISGGQNILIGGSNDNVFTNGTQNTFVGVGVGRGFINGNGNVLIGYNASTTQVGANDAVLIGGNGGGGGVGARGTTQSVVIGNKAGNSTLTGSNNDIFGYQVASRNLGNGNHNILMGTGAWVDATSSSMSNAMNIGNLLYGEALTQTNDTPAGNLSIASSTFGPSILTVGYDLNAGTASSTISSSGKVQIDGYNTAGSRICMFVVGTTLTIGSGACTP